MKTIYPGITALYALESAKLPPYVRETAQTGETPRIFADAERLEIAGGATARTETEHTASGPEEKSVLTFTLRASPAPALPARPAFVALCADGRTLLMGSREAPHVKVTRRDALSTPTEGKAGAALTAEWAGAMLPVAWECPSF